MKNSSVHFLKNILVHFSGSIWMFIIMAGALRAQNSTNDRASFPVVNSVRDTFQFNGYTNHWQDVYRNWYRYGGIFKISVDDVRKDILQSKVDIAADMGLPGFLMQEGFMTGLMSGPFTEMNDPQEAAVESALDKGNVLVFADAASALGRKLDGALPDGFVRPGQLGSHQYGAHDLKRINAYMLEKGNRKLFVISSKDTASLRQVQKLIRRTLEVANNFDFHKGLFGAKTGMKSVGCRPGHYLDIIGKGMNEGDTWFVFNGYMDYLAGQEMEDWMKSVDLPVVTDVGFGQVYGCRNWEGLQTQRMFTRESWVRFAKEKGGYIFRRVYDPGANNYHYDGYIADEGNKEQIDKGSVPFILLVRGYKSSLLDDMIDGTMVLFVEKGKAFTRETMWDAIMGRREVGVLEKGKMMGPAYFRNALEMLLLDRLYLEDYFEERIDIQTEVNGYDLQVTLRNTRPVAVRGKLKITLPEGLHVAGAVAVPVALPGGSEKILHFVLDPGLEATDRANAIGVHFKWDDREKSMVALFSLPPVISVHRLLYGHSPIVEYPVSVHNYTDNGSFPVSVQVLAEGDNGEVVFKSEETVKAKTGTAGTEVFRLRVPPGNYRVKVKALDTEFTSRLGVGRAGGHPVLREVDVNGDGENEYVMENDSVQVMLLTTGGRVIEYTVKSRNDNVLFKLWPEKAIDDKRPNRKWGYYPYGGLEDFLGQASMETHRVYKAEVLKREGDFVRVRMRADFYGNEIEKTFTLYGDTPLLEVRFALRFKNAEASLLGPQPIMELGDKFGTEDVITIPEETGWKEYRITPERRWGKIFYPTEGWHAGYDTKADVSLIGAFPVSQPLFLHMWFNEPGNHDTHYYYAEFQPWTPIYLKNTMYFTYYLWGNAGYWKNTLSALRKMNLISKR